MIDIFSLKRIALGFTLIICWASSLYASNPLAEYAGNYQIDEATTLEIKIQDKAIIGVMPHRPVFQLKGTGQDRFAVVNVDVQLLFLRNDQGQIYALEIRQPLSDTLAKRTQVISKAPAVAVPKALLERYVGRYVIGGFYLISIQLDGDQLIFRPPGKEQFLMIPRSNTLFDLEGRPAQVEFEPEGEITQLMLHESGQTKKVRRIKTKRD